MSTITFTVRDLPAGAGSDLAQLRFEPRDAPWLDSVGRIVTPDGFSRSVERGVQQSIDLPDGPWRVRIGIQWFWFTVAGAGDLKTLITFGIPGGPAPTDAIAQAVSAYFQAHPPAVEVAEWTDNGDGTVTVSFVEGSGGSSSVTVDAATLAAIMHAQTVKASLVDADELPLVDSAAGNALKRVTWGAVKASLPSAPSAAVYTSSFGAKGDARRVRNVSATAASKVVTASSAAFSAADVGKLAAVYSDTLVGAVTTVASVQSSTQITLTDNAGLAVSGSSGYVMVGSDDSAAIAAALASVTPSSVDVTVGPNQPQSLGVRRVVVSGDSMIRSAVTVPAGVELDCAGSMLVNMLADRFAPAVIAQPGARFGALRMEAMGGSGVQWGTGAASDQTDVWARTVVLWHVGKATETTGALRAQTALTLKGYSHGADVVWVKGGAKGVVHAGGSDASFGTAFLIGCRQPVEMTATNQVSYGVIFMDTSGDVATGGVSGCNGLSMDDGCSDISFHIQAFQVLGNTTWKLDNVVLLGRGGAAKNRNIQGTIQARATGGNVLNLAAAQDIDIDMIATNTPSYSSGGSAITTAVVWGAIGGGVRVTAALGGGITPYTGVVAGAYRWTQDGVEYSAAINSFPDGVRVADVDGVRHNASGPTALKSTDDAVAKHPGFMPWGGRLGWADLLAYNNRATPTFATSTNGTAWTTGTLNAAIFQGFSASSVVEAVGPSYLRWTWASGMAWMGAPYAWLCLGTTYVAAAAIGMTITVETSADGTTWTTRVPETALADPQQARFWVRVPGWSGDAQVRVTLKVTNATTFHLNQLALLTPRPDAVLDGADQPTRGMTTVGRSVLTAADAAAARTTLGVAKYLGSVASSAAMTALAGNVGDWCIRSDLSQMWELTALPASSAGNWAARALGSGSTDVAAVTHAATEKTTLVDADELPVVDSAASNVLKRVTWSNIKAGLYGVIGYYFQHDAVSLVAEGSAAKTLDPYPQLNVFTGSSTVTWTLPTVTGMIGLEIRVKNRGSAALTISRAGSNQIYTTSAVSTVSVAAGASLTLVCDGTYWVVI